jgi:hypothetical protein
MKKVNTKERCTYILDSESRTLLKQYAEEHKTSESAALRFIITKTVKGGNVGF